MADKKDDGAAGSAKKGVAGKLVIIGAVAAVVVLGKKSEQSADGEKKAAPKKMPVFVDLETFTVNLREDDDERFMQVKLVAEVKDAPSGELLKTLMPSVRNEILLLLGSKKPSEVSTRDGKEKLAQEIVASANKILEGTPAAKSVEGVNFTHLIIQ